MLAFFLNLGSAVCLAFVLAFAFGAVSIRWGRKR